MKRWEWLECIVDHAGVPADAKLVLLAMVRFVDGDGRAFVSQPSLGAAMGLGKNRRGTRSRIAAARASEWLQVTHEGGRWPGDVTEYQLVPQSECRHASALKGVQNGTPKGGTKRTPLADSKGGRIATVRGPFSARKGRTSGTGTYQRSNGSTSAPDDGAPAPSRATTSGGKPAAPNDAVVIRGVTAWIDATGELQWIGAGVRLDAELLESRPDDHDAAELAVLRAFLNGYIPTQDEQAQLAANGWLVQAPS